MTTSLESGRRSISTGDRFRPKATIVDLLDRVLDKGLVLNADLIISVGGVPLLGVNLRAVVAGMETMLEYGLMKDWDAQIRSQARKSLKMEGTDGCAGEFAESQNHAGDKGTQGGSLENTTENH